MAGRKKRHEPEQPTLLSALQGQGAGLTTGEISALPMHPSRREHEDEARTQIERIAALSAAREDGEREGTIAAFVECAAIADMDKRPPGSSDYAIKVAILAELARRFPGHAARIEHHKRSRGL